MPFVYYRIALALALNLLWLKCGMEPAKIALVREVRLAYSGIPRAPDAA